MDDSFDFVFDEVSESALIAAESSQKVAASATAAAQNSIKPETNEAAAVASTSSSTSFSTNKSSQPYGDIKPESLPKTGSTQHHILVHAKQRGNPLLKSVSAPWEFCDIIPDYVVGATACILFLSLQYHNLNPDYIHGRLKRLGKAFELRVLLVQVDTPEPHNSLKHLTRMCFLADLTLMLAWNAEEAGRIVEVYKSMENQPPDLIQERTEVQPHLRLQNALTSIKPVNKTDALVLVQNFGSLANLVRASESQLAQCPGLGPKKATKLWRTFNEPFLGK